MTADSLQPRISVVVPVLNNASGLKRCLKSILEQTVSNLIELIIIDGGSIDGTLKVIKEHEHVIDYWESGKDKGISDAFNRGINSSTGDLIAILNSDDSWSQNCVKLVLENLAKFPTADVYYGKVNYYDPESKRSYARNPDLSKMNRRMYLFHPALFVRKCAYKQLGGYSLAYRFAMDSEWCHRALAHRLNFQKIDAILAEIRLGGLSDENFKSALHEYRTSIVFHGLSGKGMATYFFWKYFLSKSLLKCFWIRTLKQALFR